MRRPTPLAPSAAAVLATVATLAFLGSLALPTIAWAGLSPAEAAGQAALATRAAVPEGWSTSSDPALRAAAAALELAAGHRDRAAELFASVDAPSDCALAARKAELGLGGGCPSLAVEPLPSWPVPPPSGARLVSRRDDETPTQLFAAASVAALFAAGGDEGERTFEVTADRFRVRGAAALEGVWYSDDRVLVTAAPLTSEGAAADALARLAAARPEASAPATPAPTATPVVPAETAPPAAAATTPSATAGAAYRDPAGRFSLDLPAGWTVTREGAATLAVAPGGAALPRLRVTVDEAEAPRNALARRKPRLLPVPVGQLVASVVPAGARVESADAPEDAVGWTRTVAWSGAGDGRAIIATRGSSTRRAVLAGAAAAGDAAGWAALESAAASLACPPR